MIKLGIDKNTILIFTSDKGCSPQADYEALKSYNHNPSYHFRGHKADIYEGGHSIPLLIRWPVGMGQNLRIDETVCLTDLMATIADIFDENLPDCADEDSM